MRPPFVITEPIEIEPTALQRRVLLSFCVTVLAGISLCTAYLSGAFRAPGPLVVVSLPNPPAPLPEAVSPSPAEQEIVMEILPLKVEVIATQDAWVEVDTDGHNTFRSLVRVAETLSFEASQRIRVMTGNAPGVELRFNGRPVAAAGAKRRVRTLEFTSGGIQEVNSGTA